MFIFDEPNTIKAIGFKRNLIGIAGELQCFIIDIAKEGHPFKLLCFKIGSSGLKIWETKSIPQ